jgi:hypothetical protein
MTVTLNGTCGVSSLVYTNLTSVNIGTSGVATKSVWSIHTGTQPSRNHTK